MQTSAHHIHADRARTARPSAARPVVFRDQSAGVRFLGESTRPSELSTTWEDGRIYPVIEVDLSSAAARRRRVPEELVAA